MLLYVTYFQAHSIVVNLIEFVTPWLPSSDYFQRTVSLLLRRYQSQQWKQYHRLLSIIKEDS